LLLQVAPTLVSFGRALRKVKAGKLLTKQLVTKIVVICWNYELKPPLNIATARIQPLASRNKLMCTVVKEFCGL
jgi:hypothetical protein